MNRETVRQNHREVLSRNAGPRSTILNVKRRNGKRYVQTQYRNMSIRRRTLLILATYIRPDIQELANADLPQAATF